MEKLCQMCNGTFSISQENWNKRISRQKMPNCPVACAKPECRTQMRKVVGKYVATVSPFQQVSATMRKEGKIRHSDETKEKIRQSRLKQKDPRKGTKHSEEAKKKMSIKHFEVLKEHPELKTQHSERMLKREAAMSNDDKEARSLKAVQRTKNIKRNSCKTGRVPYWYAPSETAWFESSYEEAYFKELNEKKAYWRKNQGQVSVKYFCPISEHNKYTRPDVLIYEEGLTVLLEVHEVKPSEFCQDKEGAYHRITRAKLEGMRKFCNEHGLKFKLITEKSLPLLVC